MLRLFAILISLSLWGCGLLLDLDDPVDSGAAQDAGARDASE